MKKFSETGKFVFGLYIVCIFLMAITMCINKYSEKTVFAALQYDLNEDDSIVNVSSPIFVNSIQVSTMTTPGLPSAGSGRIYQNQADNDLYFLDAAGNNSNLTIGAGAGDDLGNHTATQDLNIATFGITNVSTMTFIDGSDDVSGMELYVNGIAVAETETSNLALDTILTNNPVLIGDRAGSDIPFEGLIDEVAIYDRELTANEILIIYRSDNGYLDLSGNDNHGHLADGTPTAESILSYP
jgi:hypothetical protein